MTIIDSSTVVVFSADELKNVLQGNNGYNYIYFGSNITLKSGITISSTKKTVTIDGTYNGVRYTYEDMNSAGTGDTISVRNQTIQKVTLKNIDTVGHNYYGLVYVAEDNNLRNVIIEYNNLTYKGPQITFHPTGLSTYINCDISIITSYSAANEVAECNRIEIGGTTTITHTSTIDSAFWFRGSTQPYFKILENANVTITIQSRELFYGVNNLEIDVLSNSSLKLTTNHGFGYGTYSTGSVLIDKNATLNVTQTNKNGNYPTLYCNGPFIMNDGSSLYMTSNYSNISASNYNIYFSTSNSSLTLNNPKEVVLYNNNTSVIYTNSTIPFNLKYSRINMWETAANIGVAGSLSDLPKYAWYKSNDLSSVIGTISSSATTITSNNYTEDELSKLPAISNFNFIGKKVISIGSTLLNICPITENQTTITGYALPLADLQIKYLNTTKQTTATQDGTFTFQLDNTLPIGTEITFISNPKNSFIYQTKTVQIVYPGELSLDSAPKIIEFTMTPISTNPVICPRSSEPTITITDSRIYSSNWKLYATIDHDLTSTNGYVLTNSLINKNNDNTINVLSNTPTLVYTGKNNDGQTKITNVSWAKNEGVLMMINNPVENNETYKANITWTIEE